jgi:hypothetical protein
MAKIKLCKLNDDRRKKNHHFYVDESGDLTLFDKKGNLKVG